MARNGSGTYSVPNTFVSGNTITASGHNGNWSDIASEVTNSVAADGQTSMTGPLKAANGTNSAPTMTFASDTDTGAYRSGANEYSVAAGGTQITSTSSAGIDIKSGTLKLAGVTMFPVPTAQLTDASVTLAKLDNLAQYKIIGRYSSGSGVPQALTLSSGLSVDGSGNVTTTTNPTLFPGFLSGLELSTAGGSGTFGIAVGAANDTTNATLMALTSAYTKTTSFWAVGTGNGGFDTNTSVSTSTWYHVYLIARSDTGVVDVLFSASASAPTMPAGYDRKRHIGMMKTDGSSQWTAFTQTHDTFIWTASVSELSNGATTSASRTLQTLAGVPTGKTVTALIRANIAGSALTVRFTSPSENDVSVTAGQNTDLGNGSAVSSIGGRFEVVTNTSAQIGIRSPGATANGLYLETYGFKYTRGK